MLCQNGPNLDLDGGDAIIDATVGVVGLLVSVTALIYSIIAARQATKAANRASALLSRLVVYPFRELDRRHAALAPNEVMLLRAIYDISKLRKAPITRVSLQEQMPRGSRVSQEAIKKLAEDGWIVLPQEDSGGFLINSDRAPYLAFLVHAESELQKASK